MFLQVFKRSVIYGLMLLLMLCLNLSCGDPDAVFTQARNIELPDDSLNLPSNTQRVCLSLRAISDKVTDAIENNKAIPKDLINLYGVGYLECYVIDMDSKDIILVGQKSKDRPSLHLDDLVLCIQNTGNFEAYPLFSLDPGAGDLRAIDQYFAGINSAKNEEEMKGRYDKFKSSLGLMKINVTGVPENSRFAHVMLNADYHMKKVAVGLVRLPEVFPYLDMFLNKAKINNARDINVDTYGSGLLSFWFTTANEKPCLYESNKITWLAECPIVVMTDEQVRAKHEEGVVDNSNDPFSNEFTKMMSEEFPKLIKIVPEYAELENIYRLEALVQAMASRKSLARVGLPAWSYLADYEFQDTSPMPPGMQCLANYRKATQQVHKERDYWEIDMFLMVCGGVDMTMKLSVGNFVRTSNPEMISFREKVIKARPSKDAISWEVK